MKHLCILCILLSWLPRESAAEKRLFVLLGQSNMAGRAPITTPEFEVLPKVFLLNDTGAFVPARNPLNLFSNIRKETYRQRLGPGYSFARAVSRAYPQDSIYLVLNARGGTSIAHFMKGAASGFFEQTLDRIEQAVEQVPDASLEAVLWHQGESDRDHPTTYLPSLHQLMVDYREALGAPELPFICGQLGWWNDRYAGIRKEIARVEELPHAYLVSSDQLTSFDPHHFDNPSQRRLGLRYARTYLDIEGAPMELKLKAAGVHSFQSLLEIIRQPTANCVLVAAHRGDWRNAPENSLMAIEEAIQMGVDIVEVDVAMTKDSVLVLMHDRTLDRTTTCSGKVADHTVAALQPCLLRDGLGGATPHPIPTLKAALDVVKERVVINLDKAEAFIPEAYAMLKATGTVDQAIFSSYYPYAKLQASAGRYLDSIHYMPKVKHTSMHPTRYLETFFEKTSSSIVQTRAIAEDDPLLAIIPYAKNQGRLIWLNSLDDFHCAGHTDERAMTDSRHWEWFLANGANIIQTDRPQLLLDYLRNKKLHD